MIRHLLVISALSFTGLFLSAQDIHFSQYKHAPMLLNPALTAADSGDWHAGFNFREQWTRTAIPYNTFNLFFDKKIYFYSKLIFAGAYLTVDQMNTDGLTKIQFVPSVAYQFRYRQHILTVGLQPGISFYNLNTVLTHPDQFSYETGTFDPDLPTSDLTDNLSKVFADINLGATWSRKLGAFNPLVGLAMYHANRPKNGLYSSDRETHMPVKTLINFEVPFFMLSNLEVEPSVLMIRQRKSQEIVLGIDGTLFTHSASGGINKVIAGVHYRNAKAEGMSSLVILGGVEYKNVLLAVSYDEYFSDLEQSSAIGSSFEISVIYSGINTITDQFSIPCEIY